MELGGDGRTVPTTHCELGPLGQLDVGVQVFILHCLLNVALLLDEVAAGVYVPPDTPEGLLHDDYVAADHEA